MISPPNLYQCVEWRQWLWYEPTKWVIGDQNRFRDKKVLEIGPGRGLMACFFAAAGAEVHAADRDEQYLRTTEVLAHSHSLRVHTIWFSGDYFDLPQHAYDFVFTKSALVMTGRSAYNAAAIPLLLKSGGQYMGVENLPGPWFVKWTRKVRHPDPSFPFRFDPITPEVELMITKHFHNVEFLRHWPNVIAIKATLVAQRLPEESKSQSYCFHPQ